MTRRKLKSNGRCKAPFGTTEAAILGAAALNVGGQMAAANINSKAAINSAKEQSKAISESAKRQADALREQSVNNKALQEQSLAVTKEENAENRAIQQQMNMNLQMLAGRQSVNDRLTAAKIQVKNGGSFRRKLQNPAEYLLRGSYNQNMPFNVTDGGGAVYVGNTPEGYDLYELYGNDHDHYHKTKGGKNKTGVGIKFANGGIIEGEGNQYSNQGEYMLVTPNDAKFISKHTIKGFNPADAINKGMHPLVAFNVQENIKNKYNIPDSGKAKNGVSLTNIRQKLACGGRPKAWAGTNFIGAGITSAGNLLGAWLSQRGNNKAASILTDANTNAAGILADAYRQMRGIDMSNLRREDYAATHAMAALRAPIIDTSAQKAVAERTLQRSLDNSRRYNLSGAAAQDRMTTAETTYNDRINNIESEADKLRENIKQQNIQSINETARLNAQLDAQANKEYSNAYLNLLQYNNDIENQKIGGIAQAQAGVLTDNARINASTAQANAQGWGSAIANSAKDFGNAAETYFKTLADRRNMIIGADIEQQFRAAMQDGSRSEAQGLYDSLKNGTPEQQDMAAKLDNKWDGKLSGNHIKRRTLKNILPKSTNYYDIINYNNPNDNYFT